jgi:hypothetical protein
LTQPNPVAPPPSSGTTRSRASDCASPPGGSKSYVLNYRAGRGRNAPQHRITIGKHGSPWTPDLARREALRLLSTIAAGADPAAARKAEARTMTLAALCELYLAEGAGHKKPTTLKADRGRISNHIVPLLGRLRIDRITRMDVERMVRDVTAGRTAAPVLQQPRHARQGRTRHGGAGARGAGCGDEFRGRARFARRQSGARREETASRRRTNIFQARHTAIFHARLKFFSHTEFWELRRGRHGAQIDAN